MNNYSIQKEFEKLIVMSWHPECQNYYDALKKEMHICNDDYLPFPITLGRVLVLLRNRSKYNQIKMFEYDSVDIYLYGMDETVTWHLNNNGMEATHYEQSKRTLKKIIQYLKK